MKYEIINLFKRNIDFIKPSGGTGLNLELPNFELSPRDFLLFAELDLSGNHSNHKLVNATSNLKRAIDCELDFLFEILNLNRLYKSKRLGIDKKLGFLSKAGIFNSRSLDKLNKLRNKLEHEYKIPKIEDVDVYFDLVSSFITIIENFISQLMSLHEVIFHYNDKKLFEVSSIINIDNPEVILTIKDNQEIIIFNKSLGSKGNDNIDDIEEFAFLLKTHMLLNNLYVGFLNNQLFINNLEKN